MTPNIPERQALSDTFNGIVGRSADRFFLASAPVKGLEIVYSGQIILRYGVAYLEKPQFCIVPDLVVLDYGDGLAGQDAWDFIFHKSNLYPRADVFGYRNDGLDEMIVMKKLDPMQPVRVLAYDDEAAQMPVAALSAYIGSASSALPERVRRYLPIYESLQAWWTAQDE